jgi:hypothetical protein
MHDPLCFEFDKKDDDCFDHSLDSPFCFCEIITRVRADERNKVNAERASRFGVWHDYDPLENGH